MWDILSWLRFRLSAWAGQEQRDDTPSLWWLAVVVPLAGWVAYGILRRSRRSAPGADAEPVVQDESLPLVPLVGALRRAGIERPRGTTVPRWLRRVAGVFPVASTRLEALAREYERWRFDPALGRRVNATHALSAEAAELAHDIAGRAEGMVTDARPGPTAPPS